MKDAPATVLLSALEIHTIVGVYADERAAPQRLVVDLELDTDIARAAASDDVADAIDYADVAERVSSLVRSGRFRLLEAVAKGIAELLIEHYAVSEVRIQVTKPRALSGNASAAVRLTRRASDQAPQTGT